MVFDREQAVMLSYFIRPAQYDMGYWENTPSDYTEDSRGIPPESDDDYEYSQVVMVNVVSVEELETEDDTADIGDGIGSEETRPSPELLDPTPQQSTASSGATTLEHPAAYRQEEPSLLQRAGSHL